MLDPQPSHTLLRSFGWALRGIGEALITQRNMRIHYYAASAATAASIALALDGIELLFVFSAIASVLAAELLNTALEAAVDLATSAIHPLARLAKDAAAGAVLICATYSIGVAVIAFGTKLFPLQLRAGGLVWAAVFSAIALIGAGWIHAARRRRRADGGEPAISVLE